MSAIAGVFHRDRSPGRGELGHMTAAMRARGGGPAAVLQVGTGALAVIRHAWEAEPGFSGTVGVVDDGRYLVAADAALFYRADLRRRLAAAGVRAALDTPGHLVLAAFRAWGPNCAAVLEGDFAFVIWDRERREAFCARDTGGKRPLFYAEVGDTLLVASTIGGVLAHPACPAELNLDIVAASAAGLLSAAGPATCYRAIRALPAASTLRWRDGRVRGPRAYWEPILPDRRGDSPFEAAAEELRALLSEAVAERLDPLRPSTVWMSGGWDSTAVFGAGQQVLRRSAGPPLTPVSISYPVGDPGREDELIRAIAEFWNAPPHWLQVDDIRLFDGPAAAAAQRDEPFTHLYENWNRALARGSRACGARVALDGNGGDQLFQVSDVFLADLFRGGRWMALAREWRAKGGTGLHNFFRWVVQPVLPPAALATAAALRGGRPLRGYLERRVPEWISPEFVARRGLLEREREHLPAPGARSKADAEAIWFLATPSLPRALGLVTSFALEEGVELRSPLHDRRVVEFALTRPRPERSSGPETKRLLRHAVRGLLPDHVLAPRPFRTGITTGYSRRGMRALLPAAFGELLRAPLLLAELGIVDAAALRRAAERYLHAGEETFRIELFHTLQAESWLRAHLRASARGEARTPAAAGVREG